MPRHVIVDGSDLIPTSDLATGTPSSSTVLLGDRTWATPASMGYVSGSGTSGQVAYWNGTGSITGGTGFTYSASAGLLVAGSGKNIVASHTSATTKMYLDVNSSGSTFWSNNVNASDAVDDASKYAWRLYISQASGTFGLQTSLGASWSPSTRMTINGASGQFALPTTGSGAGILIGGDVQIFRSAADVGTTPDTFVAATFRASGDTGGAASQNTLTGVTDTPTTDPTMAMGEVHWAANGTATVISTSATYTRVAPVAGTLGVGMDFDKSADGRLRYTGARTRTFHVGCTLTVQSAGGSDVLKALLYKNGTVNASNEYTGGTALTAGTIGTKTGAGGDIISTAIHVMVELATNDYLELAIQNVTDTDDLTVVDCNIFAVAMLADPDGYMKMYVGTQAVAVPYWNT